MLGFDGLASAASGKEPLAIGLAGAVEMTPVVRELVDEGGEGRWDEQRVRSEADGEALGSCVKIGEPEPVDPAGGKGVEEDEGSRDSIDDVDGVVVEEPGKQFQPLSLRQGTWSGLPVGRELEGGTSSGANGPAEKGLGVDAGDGSVGEPGVDVGLGARLEAGVALSEPGE